MMKLEILMKQVDRSISLSPEIWAKAFLLGEARRRSNAGRARAADRGDMINQDIDLHGALGELVLLTIAERAGAHEAAAAMASHMFNPDGGRQVSGPDLIAVDSSGHRHGVDAKTFDCNPSKKFFAINGNKHAQLRGQCNWYFSLMAPRLARRAELARLVPYSDVEGWETRSLRAGRALSGSASRNLPIADFMATYVGRPINLRSLSESIYSPQNVESLANGDDVRVDLFRRLPGVERYLVDSCVAFSPAASAGRSDS